MSSGLNPASQRLTKPESKPKNTSANVSSSFNKSGIALIGVGGAGTNLKTPGSDFRSDTKSKTWKNEYLKRDHPAAILEPGSSGKGIAGGQTIKVGSGDTTRYIDYAGANKDAGKVSTPKNTVALAFALKDKSGNAPKGKDTSGTSPTTTSRGSESGNQKSSSDTVKMTLNDFMTIAANTGGKNAYKRAYQMFKNYKKTGTVPLRRGTAGL